MAGDGQEKGRCVRGKAMQREGVQPEGGKGVTGVRDAVGDVVNGDARFRGIGGKAPGRLGVPPDDGKRLRACE